MKLKAPDFTATGVIALAGILVGGYAIWRAKGVLTDAVKWVTDIPAAIQNNLATHGEALQSAYTPQSADMQRLTGRVYSDPLVDNSGMDYRYF